MTEVELEKQLALRPLSNRSRLAVFSPPVEN